MKVFWENLKTGKDCITEVPKGRWDHDALFDTDREAKIVVNERTGTIIMGKQVHISPVAILQGNLTVEIQTTQEVSQPNAMSAGGTTKVTTVQQAAATKVSPNASVSLELV